MEQVLQEEHRSIMGSIDIDCVMHTVLPCIGASADIKNEAGGGPLQVAEEELADERNAGKKQRYEKVHEDTRTLHSLILPIVADRNIIQFLCYRNLLLLRRENFRLKFFCVN